MKLEQIKEDFLAQFKDWAKKNPNQKIEGPVSGKFYSCNEWIKAVKEDKEDAKVFIQTVVDDAVKEYEEVQSKNV